MAKTARHEPRSANRTAAPSNGHAGANGTDPVTNLPDRRAGDRTYDAIVIGGGHNGLVNGAYLAKGGLKTLILERRHLVGGAAITEELRPGFWFTTFSYALSLLRPDIIHDLELTKHGFMPLLMPSTFAPMGTATTSSWARTTAQTSARSPATASTTPTPTRSTATTSFASAGRSSRSSTRFRPISSATIPRS
jgi:phytoene dehydrogenase-like protein